MPVCLSILFVLHGVPSRNCPFALGVAFIKTAILNGSGLEGQPEGGGKTVEIGFCDAVADLYLTVVCDNVGRKRCVRLNCGIENLIRAVVAEIIPPALYIQRKKFVSAFIVGVGISVICIVSPLGGVNL